MQTTIWERLSNSGIHESLSSVEKRNIILVNRFAVIAILITAMTLLLLIFTFPDRGLTITRAQLIISMFLIYTIIIMNHLKKYNLAKWMICWIPVIMILYISISDKLMNPENVTIKDFFHYRFFLMAASIIPVYVLSTRSVKLLAINVFPGMVSIIFFEAIHQPFGVSISDFGYEDPNFFTLDVMIAFAYISYMGFLINQRAISEKAERQLQEQQEKLSEQNKELSHMNAFINQQNLEMNAQSDRLLENHEELLKAHEVIERQKHQLELQNSLLEAKVKQKTRDLSLINEELINRNNELRQFSHTLSHNLKSPVATFQGLLNLIDQNELNETNKELMKYLNDSVCKMQQVFSDMNQMLEIRNKLYNSIEEICLQDLIDNLHNQFYPELRNNNISFEYNFNGTKIIRSNEKQLSSMLYQLISNSIKFRSEQRPSKICVQLHENGSYCSFLVKDNGKGIDLKRYGSKLFFPYQQFHHHASGKGLGLYLVKIQAESLGGSVQLRSEPEQYTEVEIKLRK